MKKEVKKNKKKVIKENIDKNNKDQIIKDNSGKKVNVKINKKRKLKKNNIIKLVLIIIMIVLLSVLGYLIYNKSVIKSSYNEIMITTSDKNIYEKDGSKYKSIGKIYKNNIVYLDGIDGNYYKFKDNNYYITYKDLNKSKKESSASINNILFNEDVVVKKNSVLYKNNKKYIKLNKALELDILEKSNEVYKCIYNDEVVEVKNSDVKETRESKNTDIESISSMPVFYFDNTSKIEDMIKVISEEEYISLTLDDYKKWINNFVLYPKKSVFIVIQDDSLKSILDKYKLNYVLEKDLDLKFVENDSYSSKDKLYWYKINSFTTIDRFKNMLNGVKLDSSEYATRIAVLNYHFFFTNNGECNEIICLKRDKFEEQMKYLQDNNYKSLTMEEYNKWLKGEIELPKKSVLLTVDDGALGTDTVLPDVLDKYNQKATLFLITSYWPMSKYRVGNLEIQSHGDSLHERNYCKNGECGIATHVLSKEEILKDLKKSKEIIGNNPIAYCYPFYEYNTKTIEAVKEEFELAFVGGNRKSSRYDNNYLIPRYVILNDITLNDFIQMIG